MFRHPDGDPLTRNPHLVIYAFRQSGITGNRIGPEQCLPHPPGPRRDDESGPTAGTLAFEPNPGYWLGSRDESFKFFKPYDHAIDAVRRALPEARVGGPGSSKSSRIAS